MIFFDPTHHTYTHEDGRAFTSVSHLIRRLEVPSTYEGKAPQHVIDHAAQRGMRVESLCYELLQWGKVDCPDDKEVRPRVEAFYRWVQDTHVEYVSHQEIVFDVDAEVAGTLDLRAQNGKRLLVDIKCVSDIQPTYTLQLGAYEAMSAEPSDVLAILHINPKFKKGYILREYDRDECLRKWSEVRAAWIESRARFRVARERVGL